MLPVLYGVALGDGTQRDAGTEEKHEAGCA